jgi:hypothetical protein
VDGVERRRRALASDRRAGAYLRRRATEQQLEYLRSNWRLWLYLVALWLFVLANLWWPVFDRYREFCIGAWTATVIWIGVLGVWQMSGVGHLQLGRYAEQWTAQELRGLRKHGWLLINNAKLKKWDIDHVLIGPAGVVVVETKGGRTEWSDPRWEQRLRQAAQQAARNAGDTRRLIRNITRDAPVRSAVALWPSDKAERREFDGVEVVPGLELREWIESLPAGALSDRQITETWDRIAGTVEDRDRHDLDVEGPPPRSLEDWGNEIVQHVAGAAAGLLLLGPAIQFGGVPYGLLAHLSIGASAAVAARRVPAVRRLLNGVAVGTACAMLVLAVVLVGVTI